jgi:hypothetical protein
MPNIYDVRANLQTLLLLTRTLDFNVKHSERKILGSLMKTNLVTSSVAEIVYKFEFKVLK